MCKACRKAVVKCFAILWNVFINQLKNKASSTLVQSSSQIFERFLHNQFIGFRGVGLIVYTLFTGPIKITT